MNNSENTHQLFAGLKTCATDDINKWFAPILVLFPLLPGKEKNELAQDLYKWVTENAAERSYKLPHAVYLCSLADFFNERYEQSLALLNESQKLFEEHNDRDGAALCMAISGSIYRTLGNVDLALKALWESYGQLERSGIFLFNVIACSFQIASIYVERKNYDEAAVLFKKTLASAEQLDNKPFTVNALQGLGKLYLIHKEYPEAKEALENALAIAKELQSPGFISNLLTELANYYFVTGDHAKSIELHKQALTIREANNLIGGSITNLLGEAELYMQQDEPDEAIGMLNKALELAERIKVKPKIYQIHQQLSAIYDRAGKPEKSLHHYKLFHAIREEVEVEDETKKIKNLQLVFEAEQTRKENIIIKQQKAEIEQKNIELQETIDELTRAKVSKKAKALTLIIALVLFITEDVFLDFVLHRLPEDNIVLTLGAKILIVFSLKPIERGIEHYLLSKVIKKKKKAVAA